jgi:carbon monoxide dehydrogenase subunit G
MDMTGERRITAPRQAVWAALNDTEILRASIPGCESLEKTGDNQMKAVAAVKLGPISARFNGAVTLSDIDAPNSYTITGEGQGGVAGFAKGGAKVFLTDDATDGAGATLLKYEVNAQVGGKIAQLGARLIDATAKQMAEQFFTKFSDEVQKLVPHETVPADVAAAAVALADASRAPPLAPPPVVAPPIVAPPVVARPTVPRPVAAPSVAAPSVAAPGGRPAMPLADATPPTIAPPSSVGLLDLVPREPFGLPVMGWIGIALFALLLLFTLASML